MHYVGANLVEKGVKIGDTLIGFRPPTKGFFRIRFQMSVPNFYQNRLKTATVRARTDRQTHTDRQTEMTGVIL